MSAIQQMLFAGMVPVTVSSTVYGSGSLSIPAGVTSVSLTGQGGTGTTTYDPGRPYIAPSSQVGLPEYPSGLPAYVAVTETATMTAAGWTLTPSSFVVTNSGSGWTGAPSTITDNIGRVFDFQDYQNYIDARYYRLASPGVYPTYAGSVSIVGQQGNASYPSGLPAYVPASSGQSYIAPSYTYTTGSPTTATLNGATNTWAGGYGGAGTPSSQPLSSTGAGQTLTYNVGSGGYLTYSYTY